jgi:hypothetical protein
MMYYILTVTFTLFQNTIMSTLIYVYENMTLVLKAIVTVKRVENKEHALQCKLNPIVQIMCTPAELYIQYIVLSKSKGRT